MSAFTAAIFATKPRTNDIEHSLSAYSLLFEGERPVWEIHIEGKVFEYISSPDHILEEGVMQLNKHCQPTNQAIELLHSGIHFTLLTWPGVYMPNKDAQIAKWQKEGVIITERVELVLRKEIGELREIILTKDVTKYAVNSDTFSGADVSIRPILPENMNSLDFYPQFVITKFSKELSWLFFQLQELFKEDLGISGYINSHTFYGRLAESANKSISFNGESLKKILLDVLDEAEMISKEKV